MNPRVIFTVLQLLIAFSAIPLLSGQKATGGYNLSNATATARAKEWFFRFQRGKIDRSQLDARVNRDLTAGFIRRESGLLRPFGNPIKFVYLGSHKVDYAVGYNFGIVFDRGEIVESIAFDADGKIAGVDFRIFAS